MAGTSCGFDQTLKRTIVAHNGLYMLSEIEEAIRLTFQLSRGQVS